MKILALETSTLIGSVALLEDGALIAEAVLPVSVRHSEGLLPAIDRLLKESRTASSDVDLFAVATGPGSFTGLRIGLATAQGFGAAHDKPVVGVSSLEGLAYNASHFPGIIVPVFNAFRSEIYRGFFEKNGMGLKSLNEEAAVSMVTLVSEVRALGRRAILLGNGVGLCPSDLFQGDKAEAANPLWNTPRASSIAAIAFQKRGEPAELLPPMPRYLRSPV